MRRLDIEVRCFVDLHGKECVTLVAGKKRERVVNLTWETFKEMFDGLRFIEGKYLYVWTVTGAPEKEKGGKG